MEWIGERGILVAGEVTRRDISMHEVSSKSSEILTSQTFGQPKTENCLPWEATAR